MPPAASPRSRRPEPDGAKRGRILAAAFAICERQGVAGAQMEAVAARAGVSKGTLYRFFGGKAELLLATILDSYEKFAPRFDPPARGAAGPVERLDAALEGLEKVLAAVAPRMNVHYQAWGLVAGEPKLQRQLYGFLRSFHAERAAILESIVRDGQGSGAFRPDADVHALAHGIQALLSGFLYRATFDPDSASPGALRDCFAALVRETLLLPEESGDG